MTLVTNPFNLFVCRLSHYFWQTYDMCFCVGHLTVFLISKFRRVLNAVCFLLGNSPASEFYMPTFRNTLFHLHRQVGMKYTAYKPVYEDGTDSVFRNVGI